MWANCSKLEKPQGFKEPLQLWFPGIFTKMCLRLQLACWKQTHVQNHLWFVFFCFSPQSRSKSVKKNTPTTNYALCFHQVWRTENKNSLQQCISTRAKATGVSKTGIWNSFKSLEVLDFRVGTKNYACTWKASWTSKARDFRETCPAPAGKHQCNERW